MDNNINININADNNLDKSQIINTNNNLIQNKSKINFEDLFQYL